MRLPKPIGLYRRFNSKPIFSLELQDLCSFSIFLGFCHEDEGIGIPETHETPAGSFSLEIVDRKLLMR